MSPEWHNCTRKEVSDFWKKIEDILLNGEYENIKQLKLSMRNSYYHLLPFIAKLHEKGEINDEQLYYWQQEEAYKNSYTQDKWSEWERKYGWVRPPAKDPTVSLYRGNTIDLQKEQNKGNLKYKLDRFQGFVFIEKSGFMEDLSLISEHGWCVLGGEGQSTREMREIIKRGFPNKPIITLTDYDRSGGEIHKVFTNGSKRTDHLSLIFDSVIHLGLKEKDIEELQLPKAPEAWKYRKKNPNAWRVELNALTVLYQTKNIKNPLLWYVAKRMHEEGLNLYEEQESFHELVGRYISSCVQTAIQARVYRLVDEAIKKLKIDDEEIVELKEDRYRYYGHWNGKEFEILDPIIKDIISAEILTVKKVTPDIITEELLKKAEVIT